MATLGTLKTNISLRLKDESNVRVTAANVANAVNQAIRYWKRKEFYFNEFQESITISAAASSFTLVTNTALYLFQDGGVTIEFNDVRYPLKKISTFDYDRINNEVVGRPTMWTYRNQGFEIFPYADQAYTAIIRGIKDYSAFATDGTDDSSNNDFTDYAQDLIEYEALSRIHAEILQDNNMQQYFAGMAEREYNELKNFGGAKAGTGELTATSYLL